MIKNYRIIGLCVTKLNEENISTFAEYLSKEAIAMGYRLFIFNSFRDFYAHNEYDQGAKSIYKAINYDILDALVIDDRCFFDKSIVEDLISRAHEKNIPVILLNEKREGCFCVTKDYSHTYKTLIRHLINDHGARKLDFIAGAKDTPESDERIRYYKETLEESGIPFEEDRVYYGNYWSVPVYRAVDSIVKKGIPDAIVCVNDSSAIDACDRLKTYGIRVPGATGALSTGNGINGDIIAKSSQNGSAYGIYASTAIYGKTQEDALAISGLVMANANTANGVYANTLNLSVSGMIYAGGYKLVPKPGFTIDPIKSSNELVEKLNEYRRSGNYLNDISSTAVGNAIRGGSGNDTVTIESGADIFGNISLGGGTNKLTIDSQAQIFGNIYADSLELYFDLSKSSTTPIITATAAGTLTAETTHYTINLDGAVNGIYQLVSTQADISALNDLTFSVIYQGETHEIKVSDTFAENDFIDINVTANGLELNYINTFCSAEPLRKLANITHIGCNCVGRRMLYLGKVILISLDQIQHSMLPFFLKINHIKMVISH